ncbi:MAG: RDD family protein [Endozoicomonas sp. (ex Botrylloides leachii)]|nr:RDD family protein [Endozoicomonas sp. (ex Botrylloides leachii)]
MNAINDVKCLPAAPVWRCLAAIVYDGLLVLAILMLIGFINLAIHLTLYDGMHLRIMIERGYTLDGLSFYIAQLLAIFCFFAFFWRKKGQTPGMQAWRICIINDQLHALTYRQIIMRWLIAVPSLLLCFIGVLWMKIDSEQKSWPDRASKSRTVLLNKSVN